VLLEAAGAIRAALKHRGRWGGAFRLIRAARRAFPSSRSRQPIELSIFNVWSQRMALVARPADLPATGICGVSIRRLLGLRSILVRDTFITELRGLYILVLPLRSSAISSIVRLAICQSSGSSDLPERRSCSTTL
jgi:hypothetical protein